MKPSEVFYRLKKRGFVLIENWEPKQKINTLLASVLASKGELNSDVYDYWTNSKTTELINQFYNGSMFGHTCNIRNKHSSSLNEIPFHQDSAYVLPESFCDSDFSQITCWLPLVDVNQTNGTIEVDQNFKDIKVPHIKKDGYLIMPGRTVSDNLFPIVTEAGSILLMHHNLIHGSGINQTDSVRWSIDFRFQNKQIAFRDMMQGFEVKPNCSLTFEEFMTRKIRLNNSENHKYSLIKNGIT